MPKLNVLIVGASIAGPTAAYWFAKAGAKVTVIERFPHLRTNGQNVDLRATGVLVMRKIPGMLEAVQSKLYAMDGISFVNDKGRPYGTLKPTGNPDQQSLISEYEILRGDLARILFDLTNENKNIEYVFGEQVKSLQQDLQRDGPITVEFLNGMPSAKFDLVVACDGANSRTRAIGLKCGLRDHVHPVNAWAAFFSTPRYLVKGNKIGHAYNAPGGRFLALEASPKTANQVSFMEFHPKDKGKVMDPFREAVKQGDDALKQWVAQRYKGAGWKCDEAIEAMMDATDFYANEMVQVKLPSLFNGRFVLVGDAGYAPGPTGTGTSLAMTGAYVLAGEISKHRGDLKAGLKGYEERMKPFIQEFQKIPPFVHLALAPQTATGIWLRNMIFAFVCWTRILDFGQKFLSAAFANTDKYKLPEYEWSE